MAPPVNISGPTAIELGPLPWSVSQNVHDAGTTYTVWYKFTPDFTGELWFFALGANIADAYKPLTNILGPNSFITTYLGFGADQIRAVQVPVTLGDVIYFKLETNSGVVNPAQLSITGVKFVPGIVNAGDIFINDDTPKFPGVVLSGTTAQPIRFVQPFPSSETASILDNGIQIQYNKATDIPEIYDANLVLVTALPAGLLNFSSFCCNRTDRFYVVLPDDGAGHSLVHKVTPAGADLGLLATLPFSNTTGHCISPDETIMYYHVASGTNFNIIRRHNLSTDTAMTDLVGAQAGYNISAREMICLEDGSVIAMYNSFPIHNLDYIIRRYSAAGATLSTYGPYAQPVDTIMRLAYAIDDPNSFWAWYEQCVSDLVSTRIGNSIFKNIKVSDGSILSNLTNGFMYEVGFYNGQLTNTPTQFGHSESCAFIILRTSISGGASGGLYFLNPAITHDIYYNGPLKVPDPTIRTALVGE